MLPLSHQVDHPDRWRRVPSLRPCLSIRIFIFWTKIIERRSISFAVLFDAPTFPYFQGKGRGEERKGSFVLLCSVRVFCYGALQYRPFGSRNRFPIPEPNIKWQIHIATVALNPFPWCIVKSWPRQELALIMSIRSCSFGSWASCLTFSFLISPGYILYIPDKNVSITLGNNQTNPAGRTSAWNTFLSQSLALFLIRSIECNTREDVCLHPRLKPISPHKHPSPLRVR